jgi:DNA polymerase I-like protein with 3'-5' exonuclease and polymerase domains
MKIITLDFETYYAKDYGLRKCTTEEYIRHEQFEVIGVSVKVDDGETEWFSGTKKDTKEFLKKLDWESSVAVAHNAMFDMAILNWHFDIRPRKIVDTLSMARALYGTEVGGSLDALVTRFNLGVKGNEVLNALGKRRLDFTPEEMEAYAGYCINDTELTYKLFGVLAKDFPMSELNLIDLTIRMFTEPVIELDEARLMSHLQLVQIQKEQLMDKLSHERETLMSNPKLAELLIDLGVTPPTKISARTGKEAYAFAKSDEGFKALLEHEDSYVQAIVAARMGVKSTIEETRTERFISVARRGALPIPLRYYAAHTGRWGGSDKINMQNLPRGSQLKFAMLAPEGYKFVDSDLSQIEARTLAWLAEQEDLLTAFERGDDVYKIMASAIYGKPVEDIDKDERFVGKTTILGCGYGMGAAKFRAQLKTFGKDLPQEECERIIEVYRSTYPKIPELWRAASKALDSMISNQSSPIGRAGAVMVEGTAGIRLPNGLYLKYPNLRKVTNEEGRTEMVYDTKRGRTTIDNRIYGGKAIENVCQALARIVIGEQLLRVAKKYKVAMTVHDAIGCIVPEAEEQTGKEFVEMVMKVRPKWAQDLPLDCEAFTGDSYGGCK